MSSAPQRSRHGSVTGVRQVPGDVSERYEPGELIADKYRLIRLKGEGGMGAVWVAHNVVLDVHVAIKLIDLEGARDAKALARRLLDEARAAAKIGHPSIIRVHDFGTTRFGDPFLAMELLDGEDLANVLEREPRLEAIQAVQLMLPIAHALAMAHAKNIVHRDVKPENIFLATDEVTITPKLLDFGIARMVDSPRRLTIEGSVLGTPDYMSPEQARGERIGVSSDVWSFSVVLYELITGTVPFDGDNYNALMRSIIEQKPHPMADHGVNEPELWAIIARGLEKNTNMRWGSMKEYGLQLAMWLDSRGIGEDVTGTSLRRTWFRDTPISGLLEVPPSGQMPVGARLPTGSGLHAPPSSGRQVVTGSTASSPAVSQPAVEPSPGPDLAAIAELSRGGDPELLMRRDERRRAITLLVVLFVFALAVAAGALISTGIVEL